MRNIDKILFADEFDQAELDRGKWLPAYLPHWSRLEATRPRYLIRDSYLRLFVAPDQPPWCPEFDGGVKVSNLQTGHFSGPLGSRAGQHRFRDGLIVRDVLPTERLFVPQYCHLEMRARARLNPWNVAALWLIGFEDRPAHSGEITVFELFGHDIHSDGADVGRGIKRINDPDLVDEFDTGRLPIDPGDWHVYAVDWMPDGTRFLVDGEVVTSTRQSPGYPMQLMLNFYDLPGDQDRSSAIDGAFEIDFIRAYDVGGRTVG